MRKRRESGIELKATYSVPELALLANIHRNRLRRILDTNAVEFVWSGRSPTVPLTEIEKKIPALFESIKAAESVRADAT